MAGTEIRSRRVGPALALLLIATVVVAALYGWVRFRAGDRAPLPVLGQVTSIALTNQTGRLVTLESLRGHVWVADLIFTRCPGPCLKLTRNLAELQRRLPADLPVLLITLTADPEFDTPEVLSEYAARTGADLRRWHFLTGNRTNINRLATGQLLLSVQETDPAEREDENDLYLHSTKWVLVDRQGRLRAVYEGTDPASVRSTERDIRRLLRERSGKS